MNVFRNVIAAVVQRGTSFAKGKKRNTYMRTLHASHGERVRIIAVKSWCIARRVLDGYIANRWALSSG